MARILDRIWVRFGLAVAIAIVVTLSVLAITQLLFWKYEEDRFYRSLPTDIRLEYDQLVVQGLEEGPRAMQIYGEYWQGDPWTREYLTLLFYSDDRPALWAGVGVLGIAPGNAASGVHGGGGQPGGGRRLYRACA